jgi:two-component system CheB/CheR fusion protein
MDIIRAGTHTATERSAAIAVKRVLCRPASTPLKLTCSNNLLLRQQALRVLVVDNDQEMADELAWWLHCCGHNPRIAYEGHDALRVAAKQQPQLVLLNLEMPHMDGCRVARQLRLDFPRNECLIIGVTWRTDEDRRRQSVEAGIDLLLIRPLDLWLVETLLMLESARTQRFQSQNTARLIGNDFGAANDV